MAALLDRLPGPRTLRQIGVGHDNLAEIADAAMSDWFVSRNARSVTKVDELIGVLEAAW